MTTVEPIGKHQQQQVLQQTDQYLQQACKLFDLDYVPVPVSFDLRGRAAGMYRVSKGERLIRYNPWIFSRHYAANLSETVPHEVAHYVADRLFGLHRIQPHGDEWKLIMRALGAEPRVRADFDLSGVPVRRQQRHNYRCQCREYQLTSSRHNKVCREQASYHCRLCGAALIYVKVAAKDDR